MWRRPALAIKQTWATVWSFRTFEERAFHSIDHNVGGHGAAGPPQLPGRRGQRRGGDRQPVRRDGLNSPGFYVNVQAGGDAEVVAPPAGVKSDEFSIYFSQPNQPIIWLTHSNLVAPNTTVLDSTQTYQLGRALDAIHNASPMPTGRARATSAGTRWTSSSSSTTTAAGSARACG